MDESNSKEEGGTSSSATSAQQQQQQMPHETRGENLQKHREMLKPFSKNARHRGRFDHKCIPEKILLEEVEGVFLHLAMEYISTRVKQCKKNLGTAAVAALTENKRTGEEAGMMVEGDGIGSGNMCSASSSFTQSDAVDLASEPFIKQEDYLIFIRKVWCEFQESGIEKYLIPEPQKEEIACAEGEEDEEEEEEEGEKKVDLPKLYYGHRILSDVMDMLEKGLGEYEKNMTGHFNVRFRVEMHEEQGRRNNMEDKTCVIPDLNALLGLEGYPPQSFYAVYDGHGGTEAAEYAKVHLHVNICKSQHFRDDVEKAIKEGFMETDRRFVEMCHREGHSSGATAIAVLCRGETLHIAWLGDSQAMMVGPESCVPLSEPHKPNREDEKKRIEEAGGIVVWYGAWRVNGVLAVARAIGDRNLKQYVIGDPDFSTYEIQGGELGFVLACDGLWDVIDEASLHEFVDGYRKDHNGLDGVCAALVKEAMDLGSADNISAVFLEVKK
eukprot:Nk52_evm2s337 gene=Nk52_evmTU2s337